MKAKAILVICLILAISFPHIECSSSDSGSGKSYKNKKSYGSDSDSGSSGGKGYKYPTFPTIPKPPIYTPPVVKPPVVQPPVYIPPVVQPPVVQPPVYIPPVVQPPVIQPPITYPPITYPPIVQPPVVIQPPITYPPIIQPPIYVPTPTIYPPFPYVQPPVSPIFPALPSVAALWTPIVNYRTDASVVLAINYLTTTYTTFKTVTIIQVSRQISSGYNYKFLVQFPYTTSIITKTEIILHQSLTGVYSLAGNSFVGIPSFSNTQLTTQPQNNVQYFTDINRLLQQNLGTRIGVNPSILNVRVNYPLYEVNYLCDQKNSVKANFSYDPLFGRLNMFGVQETPYKI